MRHLLGLAVSTWLGFPFHSSVGLPPVRREGIASFYYPGDGQSGKLLGCRKAARQRLGHFRFEAGLPVIAMRSQDGGPLCGTRVVVQHGRTGRSTVAWVLDRGPFGADCSTGRRVFSARERLPKECRWRAVADLTRTVAHRIGHDEWDPVRLRWW